MSAAARLFAAGMALVLAAIAAYVLVDWEATLAHYPHWLRPLKAVVRAMLASIWYWAFAVPAVMAGASIYRFARARGGRSHVAWKLFAYLTLWAIGSFAFFFGLFLAYLPGLGDGGAALLAPALLACLGYFVLGLGFLASVIRGP